MKKKIYWEKEHKEELKRFYLRISLYYKSIKSSEYDEIVLTREYTDQLFKNRLPHKEPNSHVHHIIPRSCGGTDENVNLITLSLESHCNIHAILYKNNRHNVSLRTAATMLKHYQNKRNRCLTAPENRKKMGTTENNMMLYGSNSYQWSED
jgi:5-methylcytosine-specific restriction endonuclease McrA